jgi:hypothetical protein
MTPQPQPGPSTLCAICLSRGCGCLTARARARTADDVHREEAAFRARVTREAVALLTPEEARRRDAGVVRAQVRPGRSRAISPERRRAILDRWRTSALNSTALGAEFGLQHSTIVRVVREECAKRGLRTDVPLWRLRLLAQDLPALDAPSAPEAA